MIEILIFFAIFYIILIKLGKQYSGSQEEILARKGFYNVKKIYDNKLTVYYSCIKRGENYLISYMNAASVGMNDVNLLASEMKNYHFHKGILICKSLPAENLVEYGKINSIEVVTIFDLKDDPQAVLNINTQKKERYEKYQESKNDSPIQEPKKSFWSNFNKKPDRL